MGLELSRFGGQLTERIRAALANVGTTAVFRLGRADAEELARVIGAVQPEAIKHAGSEHAAHPLYLPLDEQWEGWAAIEQLRPRQLFVKRLPPKHPIGRVLHAGVARLRTPSPRWRIAPCGSASRLRRWSRKGCGASTRPRHFPRRGGAACSLAIALRPVKGARFSWRWREGCTPNMGPDTAPTSAPV